jgi:hypothetical protein
MWMEFCKVCGSVIVVCEYDRSVVDVYEEDREKGLESKEREVVKRVLE